MKTLFNFVIFFFSTFLVTAQPNVQAQTLNPPPPPIDYDAFSTLTLELQEYREARRIKIGKFKAFAKDPNTIILDTRSKAAFDRVHVKGAIHLNFSDFTDEKLATIIPDKETRILIYCNNNFVSSISALAEKRAPLALNIPTFINLYGYGYKNIYELSSYLDEKDKRINLVYKHQLPGEEK